MGIIDELYAIHDYLILADAFLSPVFTAYGAVTSTMRNGIDVGYLKAQGSQIIEGLLETYDVVQNVAKNGFREAIHNSGTGPGLSSDIKLYHPERMTATLLSVFTSIGDLFKTPSKFRNIGNVSGIGDYLLNYGGLTLETISDVLNVIEGLFRGVRFSELVYRS